MPEVSIILPTYNEEGIIKVTIENMEKFIRKSRMDAEVIVVDDSKDRTYDILKKLEKVYTNLTVIHRIEKKGVGSAIKSGIQNCSGKYVIVFMADGPKDVIYFVPILEKLKKGYDMVQTSFFRGKTKVSGYPLSKIIANRMFNNLLRIAFLRFDITVFTSLFKGLKKDVLKNLDLESDGFEIGTEIALKCSRKGLKIVEIPVDFEDRKVGKTKLHLTNEGYRYLFLAVKTWLTYF